MTLHVKNPNSNKPMPVLGSGDDDGGGIQVVLPQNAFGMVSVGEIVGTDTAADTDVVFANGLKGVTIESNMLLGGTDIAVEAAAQDLEVYIAFNNTAFHDTTTAGLRHVLAPNKSKVFTFTNTPLPTQMSIRVDSAEITVVYTAAEA